MAEKSSVSNLNYEFYRGNYNSTLQILGRAPLNPTLKDFAELTALQIGSLVFLGDLAEAETLLKRSLTHSSSAILKIQSQFFLGIGCVRTSEYHKASSFFAQNLRFLRGLKKNHTDEIEKIRFYAFQGGAFFSFFKGQFHKTRKMAEEAYAAAYSSGFSYGQVLSLDLLGHAHCQLGQINRGFLELEKALKISKKIGNGGISTALQVSILRYRCQFGYNIPTAVQELETAIQLLTPEDTYSRSELDLELVRQLLLRGQGTKAQKILESIGSRVYRFQNKRQSAQYNLRFAHLLFLKGELHAAQVLTEALRHNLDPRIDKSISAQADGLSSLIRDRLGQKETSHKSTFVNFIDQRIHSRRQSPQTKVSVNLGEDPMGDLLDNIQKNSFGEYYHIKSLGLWGLLPRCLGLTQENNAIYLGPARNEIMILKGADVLCIDKGFNSSLKKLLLALKGPRFKGKEFLIQRVWGYEYDPAIHDPVLYAAIAKLRHILKEQSYWIEWSSDGYKLMDSVALLEAGSEEPQENYTTPETKKTSGLRPPPETINIREFNIRQLKILQFLKSEESINVRNYAKRFQICSMTAYRDLHSLQQRGHVVQIGRGRATVYQLSPIP